MSALDAAPRNPVPSHCPVCCGATIRTAHEQADPASDWRCGGGDVRTVARLSSAGGDRRRRLR